MMFMGELQLLLSPTGAAPDLSEESSNKLMPAFLRRVIAAFSFAS